MKHFRSFGFTLIELMVTVAVMGFVLAIGVPAFKDTLRNAQLTAGINEFVASLNYARSEAVKRGVYVTVRKKSTSSTVGWESGWNVFTDVDANGVNDSGIDQILRTYPPLKTSLTLRGNNNFTNRISFKPSGESNNFGSFALCDITENAPPTKRTARHLTVSILGRISLTKDVDNDGILEKIGSDGSATDITSCTDP